MTTFNITHKEIKELYGIIIKNSKIQDNINTYNTYMLYEMLKSFAFDKKGKIITDDKNYAPIYMLSQEQIKDMIINNRWDMLESFDLIPFKDSQLVFYYNFKTFLNGLSNKITQLIFNYFEDKGLDLVYEIQINNQKIWDIEKTRYNSSYPQYNPSINKFLFQKMSNDPNYIKLPHVQENFIYTMEKLSLLDKREIDNFILVGIKAALENNMDRQMIVRWMCNFINSHSTIANKNLKDFNDIKSLFEEEELKKYIMPLRYEKNFQNNKPILRREIDGIIFNIDFQRLKMTTNISSVILKENFKNLCNILPNVINDIDGFVDIKSRTNKQEIELQILSHKGKIEQIEQLINIMIDDCQQLEINTKEQDMKDRCEKIKNAFQLNQQLEVKTTSVKRTNKI